MCGILGEIRSKKTVNLSLLETMHQSIQPRGPDSSGWYHEPPITFGHTRLSIMDLSAESHQPMVDSTLGLSLVFNGAIYNYPELREELKQEGYQFSSTGDTEVILKAYDCWGEKAFQRFNGMFAIAIWDRHKEELVLVRDRFGIKPLYYANTDETFTFCSTLPPLLKLPAVSKELDVEALGHYFSFHAIVPAPLTLFKGIRKVKPGHALTIKVGQPLKEKRWWHLGIGDELTGSQEEIEEQLLLELRQAVKRRFLAAVPVGALLSGGVDSSLLVGLLSEISDRPIETFSIGFEDHQNEAGNEFQYSDLIANHFSTSHHRWRVTNTEMLGRLPEVIRAMSEPMVSHDCVGFYLLSEAVSKHAKVVQSGQGADEVFGGYHWYPPLASASDPAAVYEANFRDRSIDEFKRTLRPKWFEGDVGGDFIRDHFAALGAVDPVQKALHIDTSIMLVDDPVKRVDNMTMAHGLEARVPFLDHQLVEFAFRIPSSMKLADGGKGILKNVARKVIPSEVIDRPKGYFPVPALKYLSGSVLTWVQDALHSQNARERQLIQPEILNNWINQPEEYLTPLRGSKLWQVAVLELWLQSWGM